MAARDEAAVDDCASSTACGSPADGLCEVIEAKESVPPCSSPTAESCVTPPASEACSASVPPKCDLVTLGKSRVSDPETPTFHILLRPKSPKTEGGCSNEIGGDQSPSAGRCDGSEACDVECKKAAALDESTTKFRRQGRSDKLTGNRHRHCGATNPAMNLKQFIVASLSQAKDRSWLLQLEAQLVGFVEDDSQSTLTFPQMSSYHRMMVHRVAAYFGLEHNLGANRKCVVVSKAGSAMVLPLSFEKLAAQLGSPSDKKVTLLRRETDPDAIGDTSGLTSDRSDAEYTEGSSPRSIEQREAEYEEKRARIFDGQACNGNPLNSSRKEKRGGKNKRQPKSKKGGERELERKNSQQASSVAPRHKRKSSQASFKPNAMRQSLPLCQSASLERQIESYSSETLSDHFAHLALDKSQYGTVNAEYSEAPVPDSAATGATYQTPVHADYYTADQYDEGGVGDQVCSQLVSSVTYNSPYGASTHATPRYFPSWDSGFSTGDVNSVSSASMEAYMDVASSVGDEWCPRGDGMDGVRDTSDRVDLSGTSDSSLYCGAGDVFVDNSAYLHDAQDQSGQNPYAMQYHMSQESQQLMMQCQPVQHVHYTDQQQQLQYQHPSQSMAMAAQQFSPSQVDAIQPLYTENEMNFIGMQSIPQQQQVQQQQVQQQQQQALPPQVSQLQMDTMLEDGQSSGYTADQYQVMYHQQAQQMPQEVQYQPQQADLAQQQQQQQQLLLQQQQYQLFVYAQQLALQQLQLQQLQKQNSVQDLEQPEAVTGQQSVQSPAVSIEPKVGRGVVEPSPGSSTPKVPLATNVTSSNKKQERADQQLKEPKVRQLTQVQQWWETQGPSKKPKKKSKQKAKQQAKQQQQTFEVTEVERHVVGDQVLLSPDEVIAEKDDKPSAISDNEPPQDSEPVEAQCDAVEVTSQEECPVVEVACQDNAAPFPEEGNTEAPVSDTLEEQCPDDVNSNDTGHVQPSCHGPTAFALAMGWSEDRKYDVFEYDDDLDSQSPMSDSSSSGRSSGGGVENDSADFGEKTIVLEVYDLASHLRQSLDRTSQVLCSLKDLGGIVHTVRDRVLVKFNSLPHAHLAMAVPHPNYKLRLLQIKCEDSI